MLSLDKSPQDGSDPHLSSQIRQILYNPLAYIHPRRFTLSAGNDNPRLQAIVNRRLIHHYQLNTDWPAIPLNSTLHRWIANWRQLPEIAYLMGTQLMKAVQNRNGGLLTLTSWARPFASIPLNLVSEHSLDRVLDQTTLMQTGTCHLLSSQAEIPEILLQRLFLLMPPEVDYSADNAPINSLLFTLAVQYAQKNPHTLPINSN